MLDKITTYGSRQNIIIHLALPSLAPAAIICLYFTPKSVFGCANRGLLALVVVSLAMVAAVITDGKGIMSKMHGEKEASNWWIISTLILLLPAVLVVGPLGRILYFG